MSLIEVSTESLINELKARHDHSCFVGYRQLTKDQCDFICSWKGDSKTVCGMLFNGSYGITHDYFKEHYDKH